MNNINQIVLMEAVTNKEKKYNLVYIILKFCLINSNSICNGVSNYRPVSLVFARIKTVLLRKKHLTSIILIL